MNKTALITGITGQDGSYLTEHLLSKNYNVYGLIRRTSTPNTSRINHILSQIELIDGDLSDQSSIDNALRTSQPDEIYNLAAQSFVGSSWNQPILTSDINGLGVVRVLESARQQCPSAHIYQASTSEMFGKVQETPQKETTPFYPRSPYGFSKLYAHWACINYRESYDMHISNGILFNHESPRRGIEFVTKKISTEVAKIHHNISSEILLGNLDAKRDWGFAGDYVKAMHTMLQQKTPDNYVIATGETHSVREFVELSFKAIGVRVVWSGDGINEVGIDAETNKTIVKIHPKYYRPTDVNYLIGDPTKAKNTLGWEHNIKFEDLVKMMIDYDIEHPHPY